MARGADLTQHTVDVLVPVSHEPAATETLGRFPVARVRGFTAEVCAVYSLARVEVQHGDRVTTLAGAIAPTPVYLYLGGGSCVRVEVHP